MQVNCITHSASCILITVNFWVVVLRVWLSQRRLGVRSLLLLLNFYLTLPEDCVKSVNIALSYRVSHREDPAVSHSMW